MRSKRRKNGKSGLQTLVSLWPLALAAILLAVLLYFAS